MFLQKICRLVANIFPLHVESNTRLTVSFKISPQIYFNQIKMKPLNKHASKLTHSSTKGNCVCVRESLSG